MRIIEELVLGHRRRIAAELEAAMLGATETYRPWAREELLRLVHQLIDALLAQLKDPAGDALLRLVGSITSGPEAIPAHVLAGTLVRLGLAMRGLVLMEIEGDRVRALASAVLDRAIAETLERSHEYSRPPTLVSRRESGTFDPTILRNINEVLEGQAGEAIEASVVALCLASGLSAAEDQGKTEIPDFIDNAAELLVATGATVVFESAGFLAAKFPARVDDTDVDDALGTAVSLLRTEKLARAAIGVARGRIWAESNANGQLLAYGETLIRAVGLAAQAGARHILVDPYVYELTESNFVFRSRHVADSAFELHPAQPQWIDRWEQAALVVDPELVGRQSLLQRLDTALRQDRDPRVTLIGVRGRAGVGKHRLIYEALAARGVSDDRILRAEPHSQAPEPYWPVISLVRQLLGLRDEPIDQPTLSRALDRISNLDRAAVEPILLALLAVDTVNEPALDDLEPSGVREAIGKTLRLVLEAVGATRPLMPLALILSDTQDLDGPSTHAINDVVRHYSGETSLVVFMTYRGTYRPPSFLSERMEEFRVDGLAPDEIERLACLMLETDELDPKLTRLLRDRAKGLPMAAIALVRFLVETGLLERTDGSWQLTENFEPARVPRQLQRLLAQRIEHLPSRLASLLKGCATVGEAVAWRTLELMWVSRGWNRETLHQSTGLLEEMGFLAVDEQQSVRLSHTLIRHVCYRSQSALERAENHRIALVAYQERYPNALKQVPAILLSHSVAAEASDNARAAAVHAIQRAVQLRDYKGGLELGEIGLAQVDRDSVEDLQARFDILAARELIHDSRGNRKEQKRDLQDMSDLATALDDSRRASLTLHRSARLNLLLGSTEMAAKLAKRSLAIARHGDRLDLSNVLRTVALIRWQQQDPRGAAAALREALEIYESLDHRRGMGYVLHNLGLFALDTGALGQARSHFERALELKRDTEDIHGRAVVLDGLGQVALLEGDWERAAENLEMSLALRGGRGNEAASAMTRVNLGEARLRHNPADAERLAQLALSTTRGRKRHARAHVEGLVLLARAYLAQGKREKASRVATRAVKRALALNTPLLLIRARIAHACVDLAYSSKARLRRALEHAQAAAGDAENTGTTRFRVEALSLLALAHARRGDLDGADYAAAAMTLFSERRPVGLEGRIIVERCEEAMRILDGK